MSELLEGRMDAGKYRSRVFRRQGLDGIDCQSVRSAQSFDLGAFSVSFARIGDRDFDRLRRTSVAIAEDGGFMMGLILDAQREGSALNFAEMHFVLEYLYGPSGRLYDDWKGSFCFPFSLDVRYGATSHPYCLAVRNFRSSVEFALRRIVRIEEVDPVIQQPTLDFPREAINHFISYFYGYLSGRFEGLGHESPAPFVRSVASNLIVYGYREGAFYEEHFDDEVSFQAAASSVPSAALIPESPQVAENAIQEERGAPGTFS